MGNCRECNGQLVEASIIPGEVRCVECNAEHKMVNGTPVLATVPCRYCGGGGEVVDERGEPFVCPSCHGYAWFNVGEPNPSQLERDPLRSWW